MEFQTSCENLDEEVDKDPQSERKINTKLKLVKASYEEVMTAQSQVVSLEKTSASDDVYRSWVKDKVRKTYVAVVEKAVDKLETMGAVDDQDTKAKAEAAQVKRDAEFELATFGTVKRKNESIKHYFQNKNCECKCCLQAFERSES